MSCPVVLTSFLPSCVALSSVAGVRSHFYAARLADLTLTYAADGSVSAVALKPGGNLLRVEGRKFQNSGAYELAKSATGKTRIKQTWSARVYHDTQADRNALRQYALVEDLVVLAPTNADRIEVYGAGLGLSPASGKGGTGTKLDDDNTMFFSFEGEEAAFPALFNTVATPTTLEADYDTNIAYLDNLTAAPGAATAPGAVTGLTAAPADAAVALAWAAPAANGAPILSYTVRYRPVGATTYSIFGTVAGRTATVTGLSNDQAYEFGVAATNSVGTGSYSQPLAATPTAVVVVLKDFVVPFGNSQTAGYTAAGGPSATTPPGDTNGSWPDQALVAAGDANLEIHNEGISGQSWGMMQARIDSIVAYFTATNASDYARRIVTLQEFTNSALHEGMTGLANCQAAVAVVDELRSKLPADVQIWMFTPYPFGDVTLPLASQLDVDTRLNQAYDILMNIDTANSATVGLYAKLDRIIDLRGIYAFANHDATLDRTNWSDGVHLTNFGNYIVADAFGQALAATTKVVSATFVPPTYDPNTPCGQMDVVPASEINYYGSSPGAAGDVKYYEGDNGNTGGFEVLFSKCITIYNVANFQGLCEAFVRTTGASTFVSYGTFQMTGVVGDIAKEIHIGGGSNVLRVTPRGPAGSNGYLVVKEGSFTRS